MQAIEFEAIAQHHRLRLPDQVPNGIKLRVLLLVDEGIDNATANSVIRPGRKPAPQIAGSVVPSQLGWVER